MDLSKYFRPSNKIDRHVNPQSPGFRNIKREALYKNEKKIGKIRFLTIYENRILKEKSFVESAYLFVSLQFSFLPPSRFII